MIELTLFFYHRQHHNTPVIGEAILILLTCLPHLKGEHTEDIKIGFHDSCYDLQYALCFQTPLKYLVILGMVFISDSGLN